MSSDLHAQAKEGDEEKIMFVIVLYLGRNRGNYIVSQKKTHKL